MRAFLLLTSVLLTILVAGCGGDDDETTTVAQRSTSPETAPASAPEQTAPTPSTETSSEPPRTAETETEPEAEAPTTDTTPPPADDEGSGGADEQAVRATALTFLRGMSGGNGDDACEAMTDQIRQQIESTLSRSPEFKGKGCAEILTAVSQKYPARIRENMKKLRVLAVTVNGTTASMSYKAGSLPKATIPLVRVGDEWKVGALAAPGQSGSTG